MIHPLQYDLERAVSGRQLHYRIGAARRSGRGQRPQASRRRAQPSVSVGMRIVEFDRPSAARHKLDIVKVRCPASEMRSDFDDDPVRNQIVPCDDRSPLWCVLAPLERALRPTRGSRGTVGKSNAI